MPNLFQNQRAYFKANKAYLWCAVRWPLATLTLMIALALAGSFVPYDYVLAHGHPWLPAKTCTGCALCGMTRAFCAMSAGRWSAAADWNPLAPGAYCLCWLWLASAILITACRYRTSFVFLRKFAFPLQHFHA